MTHQPISPTLDASAGMAPLPSDEAARLELLAQCEILGTPQDPDFDDLTKLAAQICGTPIALISLVDETRQWFKSRVGLDVAETPRRLAFCAHAILHPETVLVVPDASQDSRFAQNDLVTGAPGIRFYAGAPLLMQDGLALGTLCVIGQQPRELSPEQHEGLRILSRQVVSLIKLRRQNTALQLAKAQREQFFALPLDMLATAGHDGYFKLLNPAFSEALGYTTDELLAAPFLDLVHPDDVAATMGEVEKLRDGGTTQNFENRYRCKDGSYRWLSWKCAPGVDGLIYASARDISLRKRSEERLRLSEALVKQFVTHAPAAIAMFDTAMRYVQVSDRWLRDYRLDGAEIIGRTYYEVYPDAPARWRGIHRRVLAGAVDGCDEDPFLGADGSIEWLQWEARPWHSAPGEIGGLIFYTQVITDRKRAESRLVESEKRFREAVEYSAIGMALVGLDGRWLKVNRALCAIFGRTEEELFQTTFQEITHPEDLDADLANVQELIAGRIDHYQMTKRYFHKEGWIVWAMLAVTLVRDAEGRPVHFVSQIEDVSERHEAERLLEASLEEKETLLKEVHHRVKNNLQVISSLLSLQSSYVHDSEALALFQECHGRIRSMALIHEKLYQSETLSRVNLKDYFESLSGIILRSYATAGNVRLELNLEPVMTSIDTAVPLGLLVNELMTNSCKYAFPELRAGRIHLVLAPAEDRHFTLEVSDDGVGLPADFQLGTAETLGMRLVRMFVKQLRGELTSHSRPGQTTFRIRCEGALLDEA